MKTIHLDDGAYVSMGRWAGEIIITANHHDPAQATDKVYLNEAAIYQLTRFLKEHGLLELKQ